MAVKETIIVTCDNPGCKTLVEVNTKAERPANWYRIFPLDSTGHQNGSALFELCSIKCVEKWAHERKLTGIDESKHEYICDVPGCDRTFDTIQGVTLHKHRSHGTR